jgi:hypothetical protein
MKLTAKNDEFLEAIKNIVNEKIYKKVLTIYNEQGLAETVNFLNQYFNWEEIEKTYLPYHLQFYK